VGAHFQTVQAAIQAASPGDRIEVRGTTTYAGFTLGRGISIEAVHGAACAFITCLGVPSGETASVSGFGAANAIVSRVDVTNCAGAVLLNDVFAVPPAANGLTLLQVMNSPQVYLRSVWLDGRGGSYYQASPLVRVINSSVVLSRCTLYCSIGYNTSPGLAALDVDATSFALVDGGVLSGGDGAGAIYCGSSCGCTNPGSAGPAIAGAGRCVVLGWATVQGGSGMGGSGGCPNGIGSPAIMAANVQVAPGCFITPPCAACTVAPLASLDAASPAWLGTNATITIGGTPGDLVFLAVDTHHGNLVVPGQAVPFVLTPNAVTLGWLTLPASGYASMTQAIPNHPALLHVELFFQGAAIDLAIPMVRLTGPASLHIH